jgi:gliding motility-associated-like protein
MEHLYKGCLTVFTFFLLLLLCPISKVWAQQCDASTPSFKFDLTGRPDSIWKSPNESRSGICCGLDPRDSPPPRCVEFIFKLDPGAVGINFKIASGAIPSGALEYQIDCGPRYKVGDPICLNGPGPFRLTFCKPGNNPNTYTIESITNPKVSDAVYVSDGCTGTITTTGYNPSTITWTSVPFNATYNSYLNCTTGCPNVIVTAKAGYPPYVDYQVSGFPMGGCSGRVNQIVRAYFISDKKVTILPKDPVICFGGTTAAVTANGSGGAPPYTYRWNTGATTQSINVAVGTYWVEIKDITSCPVAYDTVRVTAQPSPIRADAGPDLTACENNPTVNLNGSVTIATGGVWSGGTGTFLPDRNTVNTYYTPSAAEVTAGSVTLTLTTTGNGICPPVQDQITIRIVPSPIVNAGGNKSVCANNPVATLVGTVTNATGGAWTGGAGTFSNANSLSTTYTPSAAEITAGSALLFFTSTGNGSCLPVSDFVRLTITRTPTVNAGPNQTVCANNSVVTLAGTVTVATGGTWTGGTVTFSPNRNTLNATYTPSTAEITAGSVILTLTTTGNGTCLPVSSQTRITITPAPTINAGPDQTVCTSNVTATLAGSVTVATGGTWTGGTGTFSPNRNTLNATYTPSTTEITNGSVTLTLTSTGNGTCNAVSDVVKLNITPGPTVNAGLDQIVCGNNASLTLAGSVTVATGGSWTGGTGTFSPNRTTLNASYTPSSAEITAGSVTLTLTSTGNGTCLPVSDQMVVTITPSPTVNAGLDQPVCAASPSVTLNGSGNNATSYNWIGGTGTFSPNRTTLNATYTPSATEITAGTVSLTLSASRPTCNPVTDQMVISISPTPIINAGPDQTVCANNNLVSLSGTVTMATGGSWTGGTGTFAPNRTTLNATYTPSVAEITAGTVILTLTSTGNGICNAVSDEVRISVTPAPTVNAGLDQTVCANNASLTLAGSVTVATGGNWTGGTGTFSSNRAALNATYTPSAAEITAGTVILTLNTTGNGTCLPVNDEMRVTITPAPTVNAGPDQTVCANNASLTLAGSVTVATGGNWTGGTGTFSPNRAALNATYTPSAAEITTGTVILTLNTTGNGTCLPVNDEMRVTITSAPTVNAGPDQTVCANNASLTLAGSVTVATGGIWSTSGSGVFSDVQSLTSFYTPSAADTTAGTVTLTLTSTGNGNCTAVVDQLILAIQPAPVVDAGVDRIVCASNAAVTLNGRLYHATAGNWIGGSGTFVPNRNTLNAVYTPTQGEINTGSVSLTLMASRNTCNSVSDEIIITITLPPTINAGPPQIVCANNALVTLNGSVTGATGGVWSNGSGTFSPNANALNATYLPSPEERTAGTVTLTLTTTGNGGCLALTSQVVITITPAPTANAGLDQTVCGNNSVVKLNGSVTIASGGIWSGGTGTFSPNRNALNASYAPSAAEITAGSVTLTLTTTGNGTCLSVLDEMNITITPAPTVNAGADQIVCADNAAITLAGAVTVASGGIWSTAGTGTFSPDASTLNAIYTPSAAEITAGTVTLTLTSTGNGNCKLVTDQMVLTITPKPIVNAGSDQTICGANNSVPLNGVVTTATGGQWTSSGTGTFSPDANSLTAEYIPSVADKANGSVSLTLVSTGNGGCLPISDDLIISFTAAPTIDAGPNQLIICTSELPIRLTGSGSPAVWSGGNGIFSPDANTLNGTYMPTNDEIIAGKVDLILTTTANGICNSISDQIEIIFLPGPVITTSGSNQTVCADVSTVSLASTVIVAGGGTWSTLWSTSGTGTFLDASDPNTTYTLSDAEKQAGSVTLTLSSIDNGNCLAVSDKAVIYITPVPVTEAGENQSVCANNPIAQLNGKVTMGTTIKPGRWLGGLGTFDPDRNTLDATYTPHADEITAGSVLLTLESQDNGTCNVVTDTHTITITPAPIVSAGVNQTLCANESSVTLTGTVTIGGISKAGLWSSNGTGSFTDRTSLVTQYFFSAADKASPGGITLTLVSDDNANCVPVSSSTLVNFSPIPLVDAGPDQSVCEDVTLVTVSGQVSQASGGNWTTTGTGGFFPPDDLSTTYTPSEEDKSAGFVTLRLATIGQNVGCLPATDEITIYFTSGPKANAGSDQSVCYTDQVIPLSGSINTLTGGVWTTTGTGTITAPNSLNTFYQLTDADRLAGQVVFNLRTTLAGCQDVIDQVVYTISPEIKSDAGDNRTVCADVNDIQLAGVVTSAQGGIWTSTGSGTFSDDTDLNAKYTISAEDKSVGIVGFTLTTTDNENGCTAVTDQMTLTITPAPTVNAGVDQTVCANNAVVSLSGQSTVAAAWLWTTSGTGEFSNATSLNTTYTPSAQDTTNHSVVLTLSTTASGTCNQVSDPLTLTITPAPVVRAGANQTVCADVASVPLQGVVAHAGGGLWTSSGSGSFFPSATDLNAQYFPSASDRTGSVTLTLRSQSNGGCLAMTSTMQINFTPKPLVNAGADQSLCMDATQVTLGGNVLQATGGTWSGPNGVSGFANPISLTTQYTFTPADKTAGQVTLTLTSTGNGTGCSPVVDQVTVFFYPTPIVDAGPDLTLCYTESSFPLQGKLTGATSAIWTTTGNGTFSNATLPQAVYQITAEDRTAGILKFRLKASLAGCNDVLDEVTITIAPKIIVTSGAPRTICADVNTLALNGTLSGVSQGRWTTSGTGTFLNPNAPNTSYTFSDKDKLNGSVTLTLSSLDHGSCQAVQSSTLITITPAPTVFAGVDRTVCANNAVVSLSGQSTVATAWLWTTSGTGTFSNSTSLNTTYTPSVQDTTNHSVVLTLSTTASGTCNQVSDPLTLIITPAPVVRAGTDLTVCADVASVPLQGLVAHGTGLWTTSGSGYFLPGPDQANANYLPSDADQAAGLVTLTLASQGIGNCMAVSQSKRIFFNPIPTVDAGPATICADATGIQLNGTLSVVSAAVWSAPAGSTGTFTPNATTLNAIYKPSALEIAAGTVTLTLTSTAGNGACSQVSDQIAVIITPTPTVNAGVDQTVCADVAGVTLNGQITIASGALWSSSGNGRFTPNATTLNAVYQPSAIDLMAGKATLTLTTTGNGTCNPVIDQMEIKITPAPTINAGPDKSICADNNSAVNLAGSVTVATGVVWTTSGSGSFPGGATLLNASYLPSATDKQNGKVILTLTSTDQGTCNSVFDRMELFITPTPIVNAGSDMRICGDETAVLMALSGKLTHATNGKWTTNGTGTFNNANALNTLYTITNADRLKGTVTFTLTTDDNGRCQPISQTITLTINPPPVVRVSPPQNVCANIPSVTISGTVTNASGGLWTTTGTGSFKPSATALVTTYVPSAADRSLGNVWLKLFSTGNDLCVASRDSVKITFRPLPVLNGADKIVCVGSTTQISTTQVTGATYQWSHQGINIGSNSNTLAVTVTKEETYLVNVTDVTSCVTSDTIVVRTIPPPVVNLNNVPACIGDLVTLDATPVNVTNAPATYTWSKNGVKIGQTTASIQVSTPGRYSVIYAAGECTTSATSDVSFNPHPITQMDSLIKFCKEFDEKITLNAGPGAKYLWLATGNTERKEVVYNPGRYYVQVYNEFNCYTLDTIDVEDVCPPRLFVPSAFRPNGDGEDDTFDVFGAYFKDFEMTIFNRWGEIIFHTRDRRESWDGTYRGEPMPIGVYAWTISYRAEFKEHDKGMQRMKGSVTVLR